jgi:hypothetical protein
MITLPGERKKTYRLTAILVLIVFVCSIHLQAQNRNQRDLGPPALGIEKGTVAFTTSLFKLELLNSSQTVSALRANDRELFDYSPGDRLKERDKNGFYHLGDITLGIRSGETTDWTYFSSSRFRVDVDALKSDKPNILAAADLSKSFPPDLPLQIIRYWEKEGENMVLRFEIKNNSNLDVEIGALGIPMVFNNNFNNKSLDNAHAQNVFFDPYIGKDAGYLQVVRLHGQGKVLLVVPYGNTPFEAYRPLTDDPLPPGYTFEGLHEWMVHSKSYAETDWQGVEQWNQPTSAKLKPGETRSYGVKFLLAGSLREIENTLAKANRPVAVGIPGYVLPMDVKSKLFLKHSSRVKSFSVEPKGALEIKTIKPVNPEYISYSVKGEKWGRARLTINYMDGLSQTINYKIIAPEKEVVASYGNFLTTEQWYENENDLFDRSPSVISYDYEKKQKVLQDRRVWIAGLGDEGGNAWLGAIMKQVLMPDKEEVAKLETFVNQTLWGGLQYSDGPNKYGVRKSMFYYEPDSMPRGTYDEKVNFGKYGGFPSWNKKEATSVVRSYNYPHVAAAHWAMYRLARYYHGLVSRQNWKWYLENAFHTTIAMVEQAPYYAQFGQMEGTIFILILQDLKTEGLYDLAEKLEKTMKVRADHWRTLNYPFGSEMPWDSTGQEEVYMWSKYFGMDDKALITLNAILAYMPTVPHWAYNGNARRYWDFLFAGNLSRFERMIHHYGSALNAIPVLNEYRENPSDLYLLRVGYGGLMGSISNITEEGFAPCAFHSFPGDLKNDALTGDYATGFLGYALNSGTYITFSEDFGWLAFGGNCTQKGDWITTTITTASKSRLFIAPAGLWLTLDAGRFKSASYNSKTGDVKLEIMASGDFCPNAWLNVNTISRETSPKEYRVVNHKGNDNGIYIIPLKNRPVKLVLKQVIKNDQI